MPPQLNVKEQLKKVISASRRTELLAHYPDYLAQRLQEIAPGGIHTLVIWTKDPSNLLRHRPLQEALKGVGQIFLHWTVTGLGGTFLEPRVPSPTSQLALLDDVITHVGDARRVHWRYDPLISARRGRDSANNLDLDLFGSLAESFSRVGVPTVHTSFVTLYRKVIRRLAAQGVEILEPPNEQRRLILEHMTEIAHKLGLRLATCCEPGLPLQRCIDGELLSSLHPTREPCRTDHARGQRKLCGCTVSLDIGRYLPCPNRCLYCYAHPAC